MGYKAIILDIDGTLIGAGRMRPSDRLVNTVARLQRAGIFVIVATGRSYFVADEKQLGFRADYTVCTNGAYAVDNAGNHLFDERLSLDQTERIIALCDRLDCALGLAFSDANYVYNDYAWYARTYQLMVGDLPYVVNGEARTRHLDDLPYTGFGFVPDAEMRRFCAGNPDLTATTYAPDLYDIFRSDLNKARAIEQLLGRLGLDRTTLVAIGDGDNDREMLALAGCGVAMGNATEALRAVADMVAGTVAEDGAAKAIERLFFGE